VAGALRQLGGMCAFLPFDRPYRTPLFAPVAEQVLGGYQRMEFRAPRLPIWSCATAAPMPLEPSEIRTLAAQQWASRVRFTETVEALHDDGVRLFVEVGPSANLTGFVEDALKGRGALARATDSRRKDGLGQLLQTRGRIWVSGRDFDVAALFAGRVPALDLAAAPRPSRDRVIDNHLPFLRLPDDVAAERWAPVVPGPEQAARTAPKPPPAPPAGDTRAVANGAARAPWPRPPRGSAAIST